VSIVRISLTRSEALEVADALGIIENSTFAHRFPLTPDVRRMLNTHLGRTARPLPNPRSFPMRTLDPDTEARR
jgi:hypothetical protein